MTRLLVWFYNVAAMLCCTADEDDMAEANAGAARRNED